MTNGRVCLSLSAVSLWILASPNSDGQTFFIRFYRTEYRRLFRAQYVESSIWSSFSSSRPMVFSPPISWKSPWPRSHSFVTLLLIYYVTRKRCLPLHDVALGTTAQGVSLCFCGTIATPASSCLARRYNSLFHVSIPSLAGAFFSRVCLYPFVALVRTVTICHKSDTLCSFGQGTTSGLPHIRKGSVGEAPRCCYGKS